MGNRNRLVNPTLRGAVVALAMLSSMAPLATSSVVMADTQTVQTTTTTTNFGAVKSFAFSAPTTSMVGQSVPITVVGEDINGNIVTNYQGTVQAGSTDFGTVVPAAYTFQAADHGVHTFWVTFNTAGTRTVSFTDTQISTLAGSVSVTVNPTTAMVAHRIDHSVNGQSWIDPMAFVLGSSMRVPIYHIQYVLGRLGIKATWDGRNLRITTPTWMPVSPTPTVAGTGDGNIYIDGTLVAHFDCVVETKWDGNPPTTYAEFADVFQGLANLGVTSSWTQNDAVWNWHIDLAVQGQATALVGATDPLTLTWTTGTTAGVIPSSLVVWSVTGQGKGGHGTIDKAGNFHATVPGTYTVTGSYAGLPAQFTIKVVPHVDKLVISAAQSSIVANGGSTDAITVTALDAQGNPVVGADLSMALDPATLAGLDTKTGTTDSKGQSHFTLTAGTSAGGVTITATGGGASASTNVSLVVPHVVSNPPAQLNFIEVAQGVSPSSGEFRFQVLDASNKPLTGVTVNFTVKGYMGVLQSTSAVTDASGYVTAVVNSMQCFDPITQTFPAYTVTATAGSLQVPSPLYQPPC